MPGSNQPLGLIGDIGATNSRLALVEPGGAIEQIRVFASDEFASLGDMIEAYLASKARARKPPRAVLAVAAPVTGDEVSFTNLPWTFSITTMALISPMRFLNTAVETAVKVPNLESI